MREAVGNDDVRARPSATISVVETIADPGNNTSGSSVIAAKASLADLDAAALRAPGSRSVRWTMVEAWVVTCTAALAPTTMVSANRSPR